MVWQTHARDPVMVKFAGSSEEPVVSARVAVATRQFSEVPPVPPVSSAIWSVV
jgi:hypothetical protein